MPQHTNFKKKQLKGIITMTLKMTAVTLAVLMVITLWTPIALHAQETAEVTARTTFTITKPLTRLKGEQQVVKIRVKQIISLSGNNPFNSEQPVRNYDNQTYDTLADLNTAIAGGGSTTASTGGCIGSIALGQAGSAPADFRFAGIQLATDLGSCSLKNDGNGNALIVQTPADGGSDYSRLEAFPDRTPGVGWRFNGPPGPVLGATPIFSPSVSQTYRLIALDNGNKVEIQFVVTGGYPNYTMTVTSITQVP
jgi:hypothetical protein